MELDIIENNGNCAFASTWHGDGFQRRWLRRRRLAHLHERAAPLPQQLREPCQRQRQEDREGHHEQPGWGHRVLAVDGLGSRRWVPRRRRPRLLLLLGLQPEGPGEGAPWPRADEVQFPQHDRRSVTSAGRRCAIALLRAPVLELHTRTLPLTVMGDASLRGDL